MKAKFTSPEVMNGRNYGGEKEMIDTYNAVILHKGELLQPVTVRWYMGRSSKASTVYCSIWVYGKGIHVAGHGSAGGYGYCKRSAALADALRSAGIELYGDQYGRDNSTARLRKSASISGVGMDACRSAIEAICKALGYRGKCIIVIN